MSGAGLCSKLLSKCSKIVFKLSALFVALTLLIIVLPVGFIILGPIHLFRIILSKTAKHFQPSFGKVLTTRSTNFSCDKIYDSPECLNVISMTLEGNVPAEVLRHKFCDGVLVQKLANGDIRYPELKQYPIDWFGFKFWKNDMNFDLENHIIFHESLNGTPVTDSDLWNIRQDLLQKPFKRNQSPWEMVIVHDYIPTDTKLFRDSTGPYSVVYLRIHHSLAGGYSILKLLVEGLCNQTLPENAAPEIIKRRGLSNVIYGALFPLRSLYEFSECFIHILRKSPWSVKQNSRTFGVHAVTSYISIESIKHYKKQYDVTFTSVVLSACAGAMREIMERKGLQVPNNITCVCPFPIPGHPEKLRNYMSQGFIQLPLGSQNLSPEVRLQKLHKTYEKLKRCTSPYFNNILAVAIGGSFTFLVKILTKTVVPSVLISNFPAAFDCIKIEGYRCVDCFFVCGLLEMPGLGFYILSYGGALRVAVVGDSSLLSADEAHEFTRLFEKEIESLGTGSGQQETSTLL